ncbi:MAG TPA: O-methyltransferase [Ignavibacteria bacterium]|nr:O-methyltransferase [Ignavibacteria bacterium]
MKSINITEDVYNYIVEKYVPGEELLDELIKETEALNIPLIQISKDQGKFLYLLCKMIRARNALEIGTLTGFSGINIARGLADGGKLTTVELEKKHGEIAEKYFEKAGLKDRTEVIISPALQKMKELVSRKLKYDLIFIDANKTNYPEYFEEAVKLSNQGTVIILDNMLKGGKVTEDPGDDPDLKAVQLTNDIISKDERVEAILVTIGDGFAMAVVK